MIPGAHRGDAVGEFASALMGVLSGRTAFGRSDLMTDELSAAIDSAARLLVESNYVLALVGSGVSVDSGIPTFRGPGGLWTRLGEPSNSGYQQFLDDPEEWWRLQSEQQADPVRAEFGAAIGASGA